MDEKSNTSTNIIGYGNSSEIGANGGYDELQDLVKLLDIDSNVEYFNITDSDFLELLFNDSYDDQFQPNSSKHCRKTTKSVNTENKGKNTIDHKVLQTQLLEITFLPILCFRYHNRSVNNDSILYVQ